MNQILEWLAGSDLRSDGMSNEVAEFVLKTPDILGDLLEGLREGDDVVRGRTTDALEKIARHEPEWLVSHLPLLIEMAQEDRVALVKMHLAMIFGHLANYGEHAEEMKSALDGMLDEEKVFAKSWAISSLCIYARLYPRECERIVDRFAPLRNDQSIAIRTRVKKAMVVLTNEKAPFPKGWVKAEGLKYLEEG